jgi:hypothetical protein
MAEPTFHLALTGAEVIALSFSAGRPGHHPDDPVERRALLSALKKLLAVAKAVPVEPADGV